MKIIITQMNEPPVIPSQMATAVSAAPGGQTGARLLTAVRNIITTGGAGTGVLLNSGILGAEQRIFNRTGADLLIFPSVGTAIEGGSVNVPVSVPDGGQATFDFDGVRIWIAG